MVREKPIERALDRSVKTDAPKNILPNEGPFQVSQILEGFEHSRRHFFTSDRACLDRRRLYT
ncbi:hypothetical protein JCM19055_874 [Geomicrobium sp. JCM 19055]|nr:hypothetical protein JCM19055_874 [Geomicrobium sp. JCM 19055]